MSRLVKFLHTRIPTLLFFIGFVAAIAMLIQSLVGAEEPGYATREVIQNSVLWGGVALVMIVGFCLCLAVVTRHRRSTFAETRGDR